MSGTPAPRRLRTMAMLAAMLLVIGCMAAPPIESPTPAPSPVGDSPSPAVAAPPRPPGSTPTAAAQTEPPPATPPATPPLPASPSPGGPDETTPASPLLPSPVTEPGGEWSDAVRIGDTPYGEPSLVVDGDGAVHVAAVREGGVFYLTSGSGSWTEERLSTPPGTGIQTQADGQPSIALDADGTLAVAFTRWGPDDTFGRLPDGVYFTSRRGGAWSQPTLLIDDEAGGHSPSLELRDGRIHLAYVLGVGIDIITEDMSFPIRYGSAAEGEAWTDVEVSVNGTEPVLELAHDGSPHILFGDDYGLLESDALRIASRSTDGSFHIEEIGSTSRYARPYDLIVDAESVQVVWSRPGWASSDDRWAAYHQVRDGSWTEPTLVMLDGTVRQAALAPDGTVHLVGSNLDGVWYGSGRDGTFDTRQLSEQVELGSDVAVDGEGRPHVVFLVGEDGLDELWYVVGPPG